MTALFASSTQETLDTLLNKTGDAVCLTDKNFVFLGANLNFAQFYRLSSPEQLLGECISNVVPEFKNSVFYDGCKHTIDTGERSTRYGYSARLKKWITLRCYQIDDNVFAMLLYDVMENSNRTGFSTHLDTLTSLPSRWAFQSDTDVLTDIGHLSITLIDISHFRDFNERVGFAAGDRCIMEIAARIREATKPSDAVYRFGNDQFLVLGSNDLESVAFRRHIIETHLTKPIRIEQKDYVLQFNVGISLCSNECNIADCLMQAEHALAISKKDKHGYLVYSKHRPTSAYNPVLIKVVQDAISNNEFETFYQPQKQLSNGAIVSAEALIRWKHNGSIVPPSEFLPFAEESGLILELDRIVAEHVFLKIQSLCKKGKTIPISLNLSAHSLCNADTTVFFTNLLKRIPIEPQLVGIEITETSFMRNLETSQKVIEDLKLLGFSISIDDFGTGYSSLAYLLRYPSNYLKIDREFITNIMDTPSSQVIVKNIIGLAHGMNIGVVAEGIETPQEMAFLNSVGCDVIQGFLISKPLPSMEFDEWINRQFISPLAPIGHKQ